MVFTPAKQSDPWGMSADLPKTTTFSKHIRNRSNALINLLPCPFLEQNVLKAIAYIDFRREQANPRAIEEYEIYLTFAGICDDNSATEYLDRLEPKLRRWLLRYEQLLNVHKQELMQIEGELA
jgi:hypothetical protein